MFGLCILISLHSYLLTPSHTQTYSPVTSHRDLPDPTSTQPSEEGGATVKQLIAKMGGGKEEPPPLPRKVKSQVSKGQPRTRPSLVGNSGVSETSPVNTDYVCAMVAYIAIETLFTCDPSSILSPPSPLFPPLPGHSQYQCSMAPHPIMSLVAESRVQNKEPSLILIF